MEAATLAGCSLLLTIVNIVCIVIMALFILRIKEVVPLHQPNRDIANFFHHDVKIARDYNKTIHEDHSQTNNLATLTVQQSQLAQSIVNRWKAFKSINSQDNEQHGIKPHSLPVDNDLELNDHINTNNILSIDTELQRKLFRLKTFAKEYDLDIFDKTDYGLLSFDSQAKVRLLVNDLIDIYQDIPAVFVDLFRLQPCHVQPSHTRVNTSFYEEIIELLPPKWYELFVREQQQRQIQSWRSSVNRTYSLRVPQFNTTRESIPESNESFENEREKTALNLQRRSSVPGINFHSSKMNQENKTEVPIQGTRFRIAKIFTTS